MMLSCRISMTCGVLRNMRALSSLATDYVHYTCLHVAQPCQHVAHVQLNRPDKMNAFNKTMWSEVGQCFQQLHGDSKCRAVVISGAGRLFSGGLDLTEMMSIGSVIADAQQDVARKAVQLDALIKHFQDCFSQLEKCRKPVIAAVHGGCVGAGVDLIAAADIRYCSQNAFFQVKEVDIGLAADIGSLQRLPTAVGSSSLARELCFTARRMHSDEALKCGFVSRILPDYDSLLSACVSLAARIASKSPVAVQTTKQSLIFSRDHSVQHSLDHIRLQNMSMLQSQDLQKAAMAAADRSSSTPSFDDL